MCLYFYMVELNFLTVKPKYNYIPYDTSYTNYTCHT